MEENNRRFCSRKCYGIYSSQNKNSGIFQKGFIPHNKGKAGYNLSGNKTAKPVLQYSTLGVFIQEFKSSKIAAETFGCSITNIQNCCTNKSKTAKGFIWKYKEIQN